MLRDVPGVQPIQGASLAPPGAPITVRGSGGADVEGFMASAFMPDALEARLSGPVVPGEPLTVTWTGGEGVGPIEISVGARMNGDSVYADRTAMNDGAHEVPGAVTAAHRRGRGSCSYDV